MTTPESQQNSAQVYLKIHTHMGQQAIGVCDKAVIGEVLKEGKFRYEISHQFFEGELLSIEKAIKVLKGSNNFNAAGKLIIDRSLAEKMVHDEGIVEIAGVPIAIKVVF